jgi:hypothetical protein
MKMTAAGWPNKRQQQGLKEELLTFNDNSPDALLELIRLRLNLVSLKRSGDHRYGRVGPVNVSSAFQIEFKAAA